MLTRGRDKCTIKNENDVVCTGVARNFDWKGGEGAQNRKIL